MLSAPGRSSAAESARARADREHATSRRVGAAPGHRRDRAEDRETAARPRNRGRRAQSRRPARAAGGGQDFRAQRTDADPGAGGQLEVLGEPSVEDEALRRIVVDRRSAWRRRACKSLPRRTRLIVSASSRQYPGVMFGPRTRASIFSPTGVSFNSIPGAASRQAGRSALRAGAQGERRGFGGAKTGHQQKLFAARFDGQSLQLVAEALAQPGGGIEEQLQPAEERSRSTASLRRNGISIS